MSEKACKGKVDGDDGDGSIINKCIDLGEYKKLANIETDLPSYVDDPIRMEVKVSFS